MKKDYISVIGGGLAGCEAAWQIANMGVKVKLYEMRKEGKKTPAHHTDNLAELVCSNSFRNDDIKSAIGLLHEEMRICLSLIMRAADSTKVPAGSALAMDRVAFSSFIQDIIENHPLIELVAEEFSELPSERDSLTIIATGPLTSDNLSEHIKAVSGEGHLAFFDAIAPIIYKDTIDFSKAWYQSRYNKSGPCGDGNDYINCPMSKEEYYKFIDLLLEGEKTTFKDWEENTPYFNGCLPIEVMAEKGKKTLAFGPMKPIGLENPHNENRPYAVVQLRQDNKIGTLYNMVGFQTKLKYGEQKKIFSTIPGLENAEFARFGGIHRNTFIQSPKLLNSYLQLKDRDHIYFAGQITGVEGYVESAAIGLLAGRFAALRYLNKDIIIPNIDTALGALLNHITEPANIKNFQPMNINFGLFPELIGKFNKDEKKKIIVQRALANIQDWIKLLSNQTNKEAVL